MRIARRSVVVLLVLLAAAGGLAAASVWRQVQETTPESVAPPSALPRAEARLYAALLGRIRPAAAEAQSLVQLGESRSRNLLAIRSAQARMSALLDAIDAFIESAPATERFDDALAAYRTGSISIRDAMDEAQAAFLRFDWDRVAAATSTLDRGASDLRRSVALLYAAAGETPEESPSATAEQNAAVREAMPEKPGSTVDRR